MDTAYVIIMAGVTGAIGLVLFTIHLIQGVPHGQDITRIALAMAALANGVEGSATLEELDVAEHLGPTLEGLAGRLEVALDDLQAYPAPPPRPARKDPPSS